MFEDAILEQPPSVAADARGPEAMNQEETKKLCGNLQVKSRRVNSRAT
jgi:hypothetical protein